MSFGNFMFGRSQFIKFHTKLVFSHSKLDFSNSKVVFSYFKLVFSIFFLMVSLSIPAAAAEGQADLTVLEIISDISEPQIGDDVVFTVEYANLGDSTNESFVIFLFVDETLAGELEVFPLSPGEEASADFLLHIGENMEIGEHTFIAVIDASSQIPEADESNNDFVNSFYVNGKEEPDLFVEDILWMPESPKTGDEVTFSVSYANQGLQSAGRDFHVCLYVDGLPVGSELAGDIQPGESGVCEFFWTVNKEVPGGEHEVIAYIDMEDSSGYLAYVEESNETNNEFIKALQVSEEGPESNGEPEGEGESESDEGPEGEEEPENEGYSESGEEPGNEGEPEGEEEPESDGGPEGKPEGEEKPENGKIPENNVEPGNEGSSGSGATSENEGEPDLVIEEISWEPASPKTEDEVTFSVKYGNRGSLNSGKDFYICLYVDDFRLGHEKVPALGAGESAVYECSWKLDRDVDGGGHQVKAYVDMKDKDGYSEYVEEKNEANNAFSGTVQVEKIRSFGELDILVADDSSGEPVEGVEVYLDNTFIGSTDKEGFVRSEAAQGETHIVNVLHPDYFESMKEVEMGYDEIKEVKMKIACAKVPLTLNVKDSSGLPVSNAEVFIGDNFTGSTDLEGVLEVRLLQESDVMVRVEKETYYPAEGHIHVGSRGDSYTLTLKQEDPRAPTIEVSGISELGDGDSILEDGEELELDFFVRDESGIKAVRVELDGTLMDTFHEEGAYKTVMGPLSAGEHLIEIEASDLDENEHKNLKEIPLEVSDKGPSVAFQCTKKEINVGETAVFDLGAMNPLGGKTMNVQLVVRPPSGVSVSGSYFATSAGGMYQAEYTLEPGSAVRTISLEIIGNEEGKHDVEADVFYSFEEGKSYSRHDTLSLDVKASSPSFSTEGTLESAEGFTLESIINSVESFTSESAESFISRVPVSRGFVFIFILLLLFIVSRRKK